MKTFTEFETALLNGESVHVSDGCGVIFYFYADCKSEVCGLITACVETVIVFDGIDRCPVKTINAISSMEAYWLYEKFSKLA